MYTRLMLLISGVLLGVKWYYRVTKQSHLSAIVQSRHFFLFIHIVWLPNETDAKNSFPLGELAETTRMPSYYVDEYYPAGPKIQ